jgi:hypothetical protein
MLVPKDRYPLPGPSRVLLPLVLGQMKHRYKALDWARPHDITKVFPPLPYR